MENKNCTILVKYVVTILDMQLHINITQIYEEFSKISEKKTFCHNYVQFSKITINANIVDILIL